MWPDWRGECVAILAAGPSMRAANLAVLRDRIHVLAIKATIDLYPWAGVVYGCDAAWWHHVKGLPKFNGVKLSQDKFVCGQYKLQKVDVFSSNDKLLFERVGTVGAGGNSGFQAFNLALQFGATGILLIGFDMHDSGGVHYYGRNTWPNACNPIESNFIRWRKAFEGSKMEVVARGVDVVNASPTSRLNCFRHCTIDQALTDWGL